MNESVESVGSPRSGLACQNCRQRKRKCDRQVPRCGMCMRRGLECVMQVVKSTEGQEGAVQSLEKEISNLETQLSRLQTTAAELHPTSAVFQQQVDPTPAPLEASIPSITSREQSMDTVDLDVLREVETVSLYRGELYSLQKMTQRALRLANCDPRGILDLSPKKSLLASYGSSVYSRSNALSEYLDNNVAVSYANKYFSYIHPTFPIVSEDIVRSTLNKVAVGSQTDLGDRVIYYLILSIGAILPINSSAAFDTLNSTDYFIHAMEIQYSYDESATTAQILLLLTICSLFDPSTGSSWHLMDLAMQACIVMGYHQLQPELRVTAEADGDGIKLFQAAYVLDFCTSSALGLPMCIQNRDISSGWEAYIVKPPDICTPDSGEKGLSLVEMFSWAYELCNSPQNDAAGYLSYYNEYIHRRRLNRKGEISYLPRVLGLHLATQSLRRSTGTGSAFEAMSKVVQDHLTVLQNSVTIWFALPWITGYSIFQLGLLQILLCDGLPEKQRISQISQTLSLVEMILSVISTKFPGLYPHCALVDKVLTQMTSSDVDYRHNIDFLDGSDLYEFCRNALRSVDMSISN
ncbi:hypothetical protein TrVFT333_005653 [Trichoderma virens FT-333]|nr:hypothetical protein TrVFT333_005653 [Trichoderma virens FT-333]